MSSQESNKLESPMVQVDFTQISAAPEVLSIKEEAFAGHINLRGLPEDKDFMSGAEKVLGLSLPVKANTFVSNDSLTALWYGPNEWLLITEQGAELELIADLKAVIEGSFSSVTDISGGNTILIISGEKAQELLEKGTPLDLHASVFGEGQCAQTVLAKANMTIFQPAETLAYTVVIRRSFSDYLGTWMIDAAGEFS